MVHGGGNDVVWLQRDHGLFLVNVFDTEKACQVGRRGGRVALAAWCFVSSACSTALAPCHCWQACSSLCRGPTPSPDTHLPHSRQVLGFRQRSLAYLLQRYCGIKADKSLGQRADWRQR